MPCGYQRFVQPVSNFELVGFSGLLDSRAGIAQSPSRHQKQFFFNYMWKPSMTWLTSTSSRLEGIVAGYILIFGSIFGPTNGFD